LPDALNQVFSALADPSRRHLLGYLADHGTATTTEMSGELPMTRQAVAKHLATLSGAGLVESERAGREIRYRLTATGEEWDERLERLLALVSRDRPDGA